ncbi:peptidase [Aquipluma nitroreducens]|uniref:Peptidase n=1 Tax=Aquipluma nitroreducens TaxID=2010828 RepID=A0A5K7SH84_9BACT|nr:tRNA (5-methylaminomethyl-2-thiouridine)(34)-methyltransferase MnmD [Aquipluma nitroreducens]BBE20886.1 peptidase [Aquipluma nitroreducens]
MNKEFVVTEDGSHTIYLPEMDEHYHSTHGAIQESLHIYINQGLFQVPKQEISILEIGFGTGLNAYLTFAYGNRKLLNINYFSIEKYPLTETDYLKLNYPENIFPEYSDVFEKLHRAEWNSVVKISPEFSLQKVHADLLSFEFNSLPQFDLVYYDAFAPGKQPEMWTDEIIREVASSVSKDGILVTYCAKGSVRRAFSAAGFLMERIPGPIGKKEILRGKKTI